VRQLQVCVLTLLTGCASRTPSPATTSPPSPPVVAGACIVVDDGAITGGCPATPDPARTVIDLRDAWTPRLFAIGPDGTAPEFRAEYLEHAQARGPGEELYGIVPSLALVRERFADAARYRCHAAIDSAPMSKLAKPYGQEHDGLVRMHLYTRGLLGPQLEKARVAKKVASVAALATDRELAQTYERWRVADEQVAGLLVAQRHLQCEGLLAAKDVDGTFTWKMGQALEAFQRRNFLIPNNRLDPETRTALATDPHELDYRFALRVLRERVVDATGLVEDGTAGDGPRPVLGRMLDPEHMRAARGAMQPLPNAAPDLVSATTEAAARALGWTDPAKTAAFLAAHAGGIEVALALPTPPAYHAKHMALTVEIDRGDVWYDEQPTPRFVTKRPSMVLYADDHGTKRPLVRWPTTIGGWADVTTGGGAVVQKWKESDVGPRVWRDLFVAPTWLPPYSTPDRELVKWVSAGKWDLKRSIMGPGPHAAFGIMLLPHYKVVKGPKGEQFVDNGIGTHGSAVVSSIFNGTSHGCHRLYNQLAVRLGSFLLAHRSHVVKGQKKEFYRRTVRFMGTFQAKIDTRGFVYELTPPIDVDVLPGNIRSARQVPPLASAPARP